MGELSFRVVVKAVIRFIHLLASLMTLTICILECLFSFRQNNILADNKQYRRVQNLSGLGMIFSGVMLTNMMKKEHALRTQEHWASMFSTKFVMSLLMTPFADKLAVMIISGGSLHLDESFTKLLTMVRLGMIIVIYLFSAYIRKYREDNDNFEDQKGFGNILDGMLKKMK